jgi:hypothetical protein
MIVIGSILALIGALLALAGGTTLALFGTDDELETGTNRITTPTSALVTQVAKIEDTAEVAKALGDLKITVRSSPDDVFVGVGPAADVDRYLEGAPIDRVRDFDVDPFKLSKTRRDGSRTPKPPGDQKFWVARSKNGVMEWKLRDGDYRFVVMNADGKPDVSTDASFAIKIPSISTIAIVVLIVGGLMFVGGMVLVILGARRRST